MEKEEKEKTKKTILYLLLQLGKNINRTRLVKLLYLSDFLAKKKLGNKITAIKYNYYYYGPFSREILDIINELKIEKKILESESENDKGRKFFSYTLLEKDLKLKPLEQKEKKVLDDVIEKYGNMEFNQLMDCVYKTDPIAKNPQGQENIL